MIRRISVLLLAVMLSATLTGCFEENDAKPSGIGTGTDTDTGGHTHRFTTYDEIDDSHHAFTCEVCGESVREARRANPRSPRRRRA